MIRYALLVCLFFVGLACTSESAPRDEAGGDQPKETAMETHLFIGTYTRNEGHVNGKAEGIYTLAASPESGKLARKTSMQGIVNPSFVFVAADGKHLYAVSETGPNDDTTSYVQAYAIAEPAHELKAIFRQPTHGFAACHVTGDQEGRYLFVSNYIGGIAMLPIAADGRLEPASFTTRYAEKGPHPRQDASHPHSVTLSPDDRFAYVCDLGTDRIMIYAVDYVNGQLQPAAAMPFATVAAGAGPRHMDMHPNGQLAFVINELDNSISVFQRDTLNGALSLLNTYSTLPEGYTATSHCADIHISPDGRFLYGSNRGHNSLVIYTVNAESGDLKLVGHESTRGDAPRNFAISPDGKYLYAANQNSDNIIQYSIDQASGRLSMVDSLSVPTPVCLAFDRS